MAHQKRRRIPTRNTSNKRPKYTQPGTSSSSSSGSGSDSEQSVKNSQKEWKALRILAQTGQGFGLRYLIEWADIDPATGEQWEPSWVGATNASEGLRTIWRAKKAREAQEKKRAAAVTRRRTQHQQHTQPVLQAQGSQSPGTTQEHSAKRTELSSSESEEEVLPDTKQGIATAQGSPTSNVRASVSDQISPQVAIDVRGESFSRSKYELLSQISESQSSQSRTITEETDLEDSDLFASQPAFCASGIVPDTQSSAGDVSYIPVTQEDLESSFYSESSKESGAYVDDCSGIVSANEPPTLDARAQSPATSIAETVAETTQQLLSQRHFESQQEQLGIPETSVSSSGYSLTPAQSIIYSSDQTADLARTALCVSEDQQESDLSLAFVENTTYLEDFDPNAQTEKQRRQLLWATAEGSESVQQQLALSLEHSAHPATSSTESNTEPLAVAETPQISQLTSEAQEAATQGQHTHCTQGLGIAQPSNEQVTQVSSIERTVWEENALFAFHSQHPTSFDPRSATKPAQLALTEQPDTRKSSEVEVDAAGLIEGTVSEVRQESVSCNNSEESTTIDEISQPLGQIESHTSRERPPAGAVVDLHPSFSTKSTSWGGHNAQYVHSSASLPAHEEIESIRPTTEVSSRIVFASKHGSPCSRHDSSQETPERQVQSAENSSSPIPQPPSYSLRTLDSNIPPRPITSTLTSSISRMADNTEGSAAEQVGRRLEELRKIHALNNPYVPRRRTRAPQASLGFGMAPNPPSINVSAEGTRSPSTVPDRSPAPTAQTSLRTVAFANAKDRATESLLENPLAVTSTNTEAGPTKEKAEFVASVAAGVAAPFLEVSTELPADSSIEEMNDDNYDDESLFDDEFNDNLHLEKEEYIVPLFIDGRQKDTYTAYLQQNIDLLNFFLNSDEFAANPAPEKLDEADKVLTHLKNIEDHPDLTYAEAESATGFEMRSAADVQHAAQFGIDNSVKFKFIGELFNQLRKRNMHIVLLLDQDNDALMNILRTFLAAAAHDYNMPTKGYQSNASNDTLKITVLPSTVSVIMQRADLAICLNGVQSASQIRQRDWAMASGNTLPVLHLVIPQTVGHIERYLPTDKPRRSRIETIFTVLGQIEARNEVGNAIDDNTPSAVEAAKSVASWLAHDDNQDNIEWPLPSIGSAPDFMDYDATQQSVRSAASSPTPERTKRPLEMNDSDPAKRMRYTPQAAVISHPSMLQEPEVTRISDSMPGSAVTENARLATSLEKLKSDLLHIQRERREEQVQWDKQQTEHENRQEQYRKLFNEKAEIDRAHESLMRNHDKIRGQLDVQATELRTLREELDAQRTLGLASSDKKDVEITQLRMELQAAKIERDKAINSEKSNEKTHEYTRAQYQTASNAVGQLRSEVEALEAQNKKLAHEASGQHAKAKELFLDESMKEAMKQNKILKTELESVKTKLRQTQEELNRAKNNSGRAAYGTRAQSTTPQPKTRSRAASPERGTRMPRGGGRISTLVAEER